MGQFLGIGDGIKVGVAAIKTFLGQPLAFYGLVLAFEDRRDGGGAIGHAPELLSQLAVGLRSMVHLFADTQCEFLEDQVSTIRFPILFEDVLNLKEFS